LMMAVDSNLVINTSLYQNLNYDPFRDFAPIAVIAKLYMVRDQDRNQSCLLSWDCSGHDRRCRGRGRRHVHWAAIGQVDV
jgi:hypothetical protein